MSETDRNHQVIFREIQRFRQKWIWFLLIPQTLLVIVVFGYGMITQLLLGHHWGNRPVPDTALIIIGTLTIFLTSAITTLFFLMKLTTEVRVDGLSLRFYPFPQKLIPFNTIAKCEVREYNPIREYGGWGIRYGRKGKAYNVSGNRGVQIEFLTGKSLLIGSQRPQDLAQAIRTGMGKSHRQSTMTSSA